MDIRNTALAAIRFLPLLVLAFAAHADDAVRVEKRGEFEFSIAPVPTWVDERAVAAQWDAQAAGSDERSWRNWLIDAQVDRRGSTRAAWYDQAYEAMSSELVGEAAKYEIEFVPEYQKLALHRVALRRNGQWFDRLKPASITLARRESEFESDMATGEVAALVVIEDVRAGDVVRVSYSLEGSNPVLARMDTDAFRFAWVSPILDRDVRVLYPAGAKVSTRSDRGAPEAKVASAKGGVEVRASAHGVAAIHDDADYPSWYSPWPTLQVGEERAWADVARWALTLYPAPAPLPDELEGRIAEWRALPTRDARMLAALRAVQEEVRYFGTELGESTHRPAEPAETWRRRYGDCKDKARLLSAVLHELGVQAEPALVSAGTGRGVRDQLPSGAAFDHVIVRARDGDRTWWLDPTMTLQRGALDAIAVSDFGAALPVTTGVTGLVDVVRQPRNDGKQVRERWEPSADGKTAELTITSAVTGALADDMRRQLSSQGEEAVSRRFAEYYRRSFGELEVVAPLAARDDEAANRIELVERYRMLKPWADETAGERAIDVVADSIGEVAQLPRATERKSPLALGDPVRIEHSIEIALPPGWRVSDAVSPLRVDGKGISFERTATPGKDAIVVGERFERALPEVALADVREHLSARRRIVDATGFRLILELPGKSKQKSRDDRMQQLMKGIMDEREQRRGGDEGRR